MPATITVRHTISMGHRLPEYEGICSSPHGHNVTFELEIETSEYFLDFKEVGRDMKAWLEPLDHAMVLQHSDPLFTTLLDAGFRVFSFLESPTTEKIAEWFFDKMRQTYNVVRVTVHETDKYSGTLTPGFLPGCWHLNFRIHPVYLG